MDGTNYLGSTLVFGGQAGSEGKGAIVGYLARRHKWDGAICSFMTNAGHSWVDDDGKKFVVQQLPMAVVNPEIPVLMVGPGSAITLDQLRSEIEMFDKAGFKASDRLRIHRNAMIIEEEDAQFEKGNTLYIGSTAKGCGRALARKVMRQKDVRLAKSIPWLQEFLCDTTELSLQILEQSGSLLVEGSQGFDLDLNHGFEYPYCTSRGTTPMQTLADCGISPDWIGNTLAVIRTYPIRVGNPYDQNQTQVGYSGPMGGKEINFDIIRQRSGYDHDIAEFTTVTGRLRRIFEFDWARVSWMVRMTRPTTMALTFADYLDAKIAGKSTASVDLSQHPKVTDFVDKVNEICPVHYVKTGARDSDMIDLTFVPAELAG